MTEKIVLKIYGVSLFIISVPFTLLHLVADPDDAPISFIQHIVAALANFFGPWGVLIVRIVDFPNAGLRSFSLTIAITLTLLAAVLIGLPLYVKKRPVQYLCILFWTVFLVIWFTIGLSQIADGLL